MLRFNSWVGKICWRRDKLPAPVVLGFPCGSPGKESACNVEDQGSIHGLGRYPGERSSYPLQYSSLEKSMDCTVHGVTKSQKGLSDFHLCIHTHTHTHTHTHIHNLYNFIGKVHALRTLQKAWRHAIFRERWRISTNDQFQLVNYVS